MGEMLVSDLSMASRGDEYALSPAHICQPFSGGMVFYFYPYHIAWSLPRTLILVPSFFLTWSHVSIFLGGSGVFLLILFLFFHRITHYCSPLLAGYGARTHGVYQHPTLNGLKKNKNKKQQQSFPVIRCGLVTMPAQPMRLSVPCGLCDHAGSADAVVCTMRSL